MSINYNLLPPHHQELEKKPSAVFFFPVQKMNSLYICFIIQADCSEIKLDP